MKISHREQKKQQMRQALIASALELFADKGFEATTIADIAERANCAPRTFFLYFTSKEDLLPAALEQAALELETLLSERPATTTTLKVLEAWTLDKLERHAVLEHGKSNQDAAFIARQKYHLTQLLEPILVKAFAKDLGLPPNAQEPKLAALSAIALLNVFDFQDTHTERVAWVLRGIAFLEAGTKTLKR